MKVRKELLNWRNWAMLGIVMVAVVALIAMPVEGLPLWEWGAVFVVTKGVAIGCMCLGARLLSRWTGSGKAELLERLTREE